MSTWCINTMRKPLFTYLPLFCFSVIGTSTTTFLAVVAAIVLVVCLKLKLIDIKKMTVGNVSVEFENSRRQILDESVLSDIIGSPIAQPTLFTSSTEPMQTTSSTEPMQTTSSAEPMQTTSSAEPVEDILSTRPGHSVVQSEQLTVVVEPSAVAQIELQAPISSRTRSKSSVNIETDYSGQGQFTKD